MSPSQLRIHLKRRTSNRERDVTESDWLCVAGEALVCRSAKELLTPPGIEPTSTGLADQAIAIGSIVYRKRTQQEASPHECCAVDSTIALGSSRRDTQATRGLPRRSRR